MEIKQNQVEFGVVVFFDRRRGYGQAIDIHGGHTVEIKSQFLYKIQHNASGPFFSDDLCRRPAAKGDPIVFIRNRSNRLVAWHWGYRFYWDNKLTAPTPTTAVNPPAPTAENQVANKDMKFVQVSTSTGTHGKKNGHVHTLGPSLDDHQVLEEVTELDLELREALKTDPETLARGMNGRKRNSGAIHRQARKVLGLD